jgi:hypothetical protein
MLAAAGDFMLWRSSIVRAEGVRWPNEFLVPGVDRSVLPMFFIWVGLWLFWQAIALNNLWRGLAGIDARR